MPDVVERRIAGLTIRIDRDSCMDNESCVAVAPEVFRIDDDRICAFVDPTGTIDRARLIEACGLCPVDALTVLDEDGTQIVP